MPTNYLHLTSIAELIDKIAFVVDFIVGIFLILMTLFCVRKIFGTFKYLMVIFTTMSLVMACIETVFGPNLHSYNNGYVYFSLHKPFGLQRETLMLLLPLYAGTYALTISLLAVQFVYRYWALFSLDYMTYFRGWKSLIWVAYCSFWWVAMYLAEYFLLHMDVTSENYFKEEMLRRYNVLPSEIPMFTFLAFDPVDGSLRLQDLPYLFVLSSAMGVPYATMIYCGWKMNTKMEEKLTGLSSALKHHHRQLFKALVLQISAPSLLLFSPLMVLIYLPFFQIENSVPAGAIFTAFNVYPVMDSIIVLIVVTEYRAAAKRKYNAFRKKFHAWRTEADRDPGHTSSTTETLRMSRINAGTS